VINLLPPDLKEEYRFARLNTHLRHWLIGSLAGLVGLIALAVFGFLYMNHTIDTYQTTIAQNNRSLQAQDVDTIDKQVKDLSSNLSLMLKVLSREVLWADLLKQLGTITPSNVVLTNLSISQTQNAISITAQSKDYDAGAQLFTNLNAADNQIFSKADLNSISCTSSTSTSGGSGSLSSGISGGSYNSGSGSTSTSTYPCNVSIRALFVQNSPFLFTNSKGARS